MYSELKITFLKNFGVSSKLKIGINDSSGFNEYTWDWKVSRTSAFEVVAYISTGIGTQTAINFKDAFDLDIPTGFSLNVVTNELTISALDEDVSFVSIQVTGKDFDNNPLQEGDQFEFVITNYFPVPDIDTVPMALTKSPHYINIPFLLASTVSATVKLYVWSGLLSEDPASESYKMTIPRPSIDFEEFNVNIADLIDESLDPTLDINLSTFMELLNVCDDCVKWVKYEVSYEDPDAFIEDIQGYLIAADGYGYYSEGVNPTFPNDLILTSSRLRKVSRDGVILLPIINNGVITEVEATGYPLESIYQPQYVNPPTSGNSSNKIVQYVKIKLSEYKKAKYIQLEIKPTGEKLIYEIIDECRYNPIQVFFKNKYGQFDHITLFKKSGKSINVKNDDFVNNYIKNGTYDITKHQQKKINITATESIKANSGYISEQENELYKELLLSDSVYLFEKEELIPVNVKTRSLDYKTRVNDQLVNYELSFDYAYNIIQNV